MIENVPSIPNKEKGKRSSKDSKVPALALEAAELFLTKEFLKSELKAQIKVSGEAEQRADHSKLVAKDIQNKLVDYVGYNRFLFRAVDSYRREVNDAYAQLEEAWNSGYLARAKEEALRRMEARKRERENRIDTKVVNLIRGRVTSLMTTVPQMISSLGNGIRNIF